MAVHRVRRIDVADRHRRRRLLRRGLIATCLAFAGCTGDECLTDLNADCAPLYDPTFQNVFDRTLKPSCGLAGSSCHGAEGHQNGLVLDEIEMAHTLLLEGRVEPNDAACSLMMQRLESDDPGYQMPVGGKLSEAERCAIQRWIQNGAMR